MVYLRAAKKINSKSSLHKEKTFCVCLHELMDDETSGGNHFAVQAGQVIMLYTFSLYSAVCQ